MINVSVALSQTLQLMLRDHGYGASASRGVPVYVPAFASTNLYCLVLRKDDNDWVKKCMEYEVVGSRRSVSGWMFLLVPAHPGRPVQRAVKWLCVCVCVW